MDDSLSKPFQRQQIVEVLARWLNVSTVAAESLRAGPLSVSGSAIDAAVYGRVEETMREDLPLLVAEFLSSTAQYIEEIARAADLHDADTIRSRVHTMQSSCMTIGALRLAELAAELGLRAVAVEFDEYTGAADRLRTEFESVRIALDRLADGAVKAA